MLRIYPVMLDFVTEVSPLIGRIARHDPDLARQRRRADGESSGLVRDGLPIGPFETDNAPVPAHAHETDPTPEPAHASVRSRSRSRSRSRNRPRSRVLPQEPIPAEKWSKM